MYRCTGYTCVREDNKIQKLNRRQRDVVHHRELKCPQKKGCIHSRYPMMLGGYLRGREGRIKSEELWWWTWPLSTHRSLLSRGHDNRWPVPLPTWHLHWADQPDICRRVWGLSWGDVLWLGDRYAIICDVTTGTGVLITTGTLPLWHYRWDRCVTTGALPLGYYHWDGCVTTGNFPLGWVYYYMDGCGHWHVTTGMGVTIVTCYRCDGYVTTGMLPLGQVCYHWRYHQDR